MLYIFCSNSSVIISDLPTNPKLHNYSDNFITLFLFGAVFGFESDVCLNEDTFYQEAWFDKENIFLFLPSTLFILLYIEPI